MGPMAVRSYHSPLRDAQAQATRDLILDALTEIASADGFEQVVIRDLASAAGVSERTVYRHFPDRQALLDGLIGRMAERGGWNRQDVDVLTSLPAMAAAVETTFRQFDENEAETRAAARLNLDPARSAQDTVQRTERIARLVDDALPQLDRTDRQGVLAVIRTLISSRTWLRMRDEFGLTGSEAARFVRWTIELMIADLEGRTELLAYDDASRADTDA